MTTANDNDDDNNNNNVDMRHTLTEWERESVIRLKEACEEQNVPFKSIFELAKYVLVVKSMYKDDDPKADDKRLKAALKRLKKRNHWEDSLKFHMVSDPFATIEEMEEKCPGYFVNDYLEDTDGRKIVGHHKALVPTKFLTADKENARKFLVVERLRIDLSAADMEEARRGMAMVSITDGKMTVSRALSYIRFLMVVRENLLDMHSNRLLRVYSEVPSLVAYLVPVATKLLQKKLADRIVVVTRKMDLDQYIGKKAPEGQTLSARDWALDRRKVYEETLEKLKL